MPPKLPPMTTVTLGTVAVAVPSFRLKTLDTERMVALLWQTARNISHDLGGDIPAPLNHIWQKAALGRAMA